MFLVRQGACISPGLQLWRALSQDLQAADNLERAN